MSFERELLTMKETSMFKAICHLTNDRIINFYAVFIMMTNKQKLYVLLLQNYNTFSKHKRLSISFKTLNTHINKIEKTEKCQTKKTSYRH